MRDAVLAVSVLAGALLACGHRPPIVADSLRNRVVAELDCPAADVVVTPLGAGGYRVVACGRRATFSCQRHEDKERPFAAYPFKDTCAREEPWSE